MRLSSNNKSIHFKTAIMLSLLFIAAGCATIGRSVDKDAPEWVVNPPSGDVTSEFFVASGIDTQGVQSHAEMAAAYEMISKILEQIGVVVAADTNEATIAKLKDFEEQLHKQIQQPDENLVSGFAIIDHYVRTQNGEIKVYLLGRYDREELKAETQRFPELFQEQREAIDVPENRARSLYESGQYGAALPYLLQAAAAAAISDVDDADVRFDRNMMLAREIVDNLILELERDYISAVVHQGVDEAIVVSAYYIADGKRVPVSNLPIQVGYREVLEGRRLAIRTAQIHTDNNGLGVFQHPAPTYVGNERVTFSLDLASDMKPLHSLGGRYRSLVRSLEDTIMRARTSLQLEVESRAGNIPTAILILDADIAGNPIREQATVIGLQEALGGAGYVIHPIDLPAELLMSLSDEEILQAVRAGYGNEVERLLFGIVKIIHFNESDGFIVNVSGTIRAVDIHTGEMLHTITTSSRTRGTSSSRAISSAFRNLGSSVGQDMLRSLP